MIGGGPGGYVAAIKAAQLGLKVACVESRGKLGGTCLNVGCIPSKALLNDSHYFHMARHDFSNRGIKVGNVELDLPALMQHKDSVVSKLTSGVEMLFKKNKVQYVKGFGKFKTPRDIVVDLADGTQTVLNTKNVLIATGSEPTPFPTAPVRARRSGFERAKRQGENKAWTQEQGRERRKQREGKGEQDKGAGTRQGETRKGLGRGKGRTWKVKDTEMEWQRQR